MKKIVIEVQEGKDRIPKNFIFNNRLYLVNSATMCSFQSSLLGNKGFKTICKVEGQKKDIIIWLGHNEWFVEY